jgi:hypothetical protein
MGRIQVAEPADWDAASWEGSRRRQHRAFQALPFREKVAAIEQLGEVAEFFAERRRLRRLSVTPRPTAGAPGDDTTTRT